MLILLKVLTAEINGLDFDSVHKYKNIEKNELLLWKLNTNRNYKDTSSSYKPDLKSNLRF